MFIFSVLTSFSLNFNFSPQIKSLFIFIVLTSFLTVFKISGRKRMDVTVSIRKDKYDDTIAVFPCFYSYILEAYSRLE